MAPLKDVQPLTGYIRGGVTLFGASKPFPVYIDETAILFDKISVSAGARGTQLILSPDDYLRAAQALDVEVADRRPHQGPAALAHGSRRAEDCNDPRPLDPSRQRPAHRVALARRHHLHALLLRCWSWCSSPSPSIRSGAFSREIAGGVLCVATMFASVSALNQAWAREIRHQVMDAQRMAPTPGAELFLAKVIANFLFVTIVQIVLAPSFSSSTTSASSARPGCLLLVLPLGTWALVANGIFFAALAIRSRNRELLLSLILFPIFMPALLAMVLATTSILTGDSDPSLWIKLLARLRHHLHHRQPAALRRDLSRGVEVHPRWRPLVRLVVH